MDLIVDFFSRPELSNPFTGMWYLFANGGWFFIGIALIKGLWELWFFEIKNHFAASCTYVLLAINVPKQTEQTPKAAENIFAHMEGLYREPATKFDKYWVGENQQNFAVELVSRSGNIQYFCWIESRFRHIFEAAVFAQYPDAEIKEASDYTEEFPKSWPDEKYDMYSWEIKLIKPELYPIRTHVSFVYQVTGLMKDPLASLLEFMATLKPGEEIWMQFCLVPTDDSWHKGSHALINKLIGAPEKAKKKGILSGLLNGAFDLFFHIFHMAAGGAPITIESKGGAKEQLPSLMMHLSPGQKGVIEQIELKASKPGYLAKIRIVYIAPKEVFSKAAIFSGVLGAFRQIGGTELNSFKMDRVKTSAYYFFTKQRIARKQNKMWRAYKGRSNKRGGPNYIFNIEELATLWHFPMIDTKAPLISKTISKQAEPPPNLPLREGRSAPVQSSKKDEDIPDNVPFM